MSAIFDAIERTPEGLVLPAVVADLTPEQLADISNGCGPVSMKFKLIPDALLGVSFRSACNGHDAMYHFGEPGDGRDKEEADILFLGNMLRAVNAHYPGDGLEDRLMRKAGRQAAFLYFEAVADWGKQAYEAGKAVR